RLYVPPAGERIRWATRQDNKLQNWQMYFVGTDKAVHFLDQVGREVLATPLAYDQTTDEIKIVGRLVEPERDWVWDIPQWYLPLHTQASSPEARVVVYDSAGRECQPRQESLARPGVTRITPVLYSDMLVEPSFYQALAGLGTSPMEAVTLMGTMGYLE